MAAFVGDLFQVQMPGHFRSRVTGVQTGQRLRINTARFFQIANRINAADRNREVVGSQGCRFLKPDRSQISVQILNRTIEAPIRKQRFL